MFVDALSGRPYVGSRLTDAVFHTQTRYGHTQRHTHTHAHMHARTRAHARAQTYASHTYTPSPPPPTHTPPPPHTRAFTLIIMTHTHSQAEILLLSYKNRYQEAQIRHKNLAHRQTYDQRDPLLWRRWGAEGLGSGRHFFCCLVEERPGVRESVNDQRDPLLWRRWGEGGGASFFFFTVL